MTVRALDAENQQLKAELAGLREILGSAGSYVYTKDLESRYTYVNALTCKLFQAPFEDIVGQYDTKFFAADIAASLQANDRQVLSTRQALVREEKLTLPDTGVTRYYVAVKAPLYNEQGHVIGICGVSTDVTAQRSAEARQEETRLLLETVLNNVEANIYMKDSEGRYLYANQNALDSVQMTTEQLIGRSDADLFPSELADAYRQVDGKVFQTGEPQRAEEMYVDELGTKHYYWSTKMLLHRPDKSDCLIGFSTNITNLKRADEAVTRSEARFRALFEASSEAIAVITRTRFLDCNEAALKLMGVPNKAEFRKLTPVDLSPDQQSCGTASHLKAREFIEQSFKAGRHQFEWTLQRYDTGAQVPVEATVVAVDLDEGSALLITIRDLSERKRYEEQINRLAYYDALTQLPNRRLLHDRLSQALAQLRRSEQHGCIIYLDLDNFKPLNDRHGHNAGDILLQEVGRRLVSLLRSQDTVARQGGDEFVVLLTELDTQQDVAVGQATHVAEKILHELARPYLMTVKSDGGVDQAVEHCCTASLGVTLFRSTDTNIDNILRRADDAMYRAKAKGRNQLCFGEAWVA